MMVVIFAWQVDIMEVYAIRDAGNDKLCKNIDETST